MKIVKAAALPPAPFALRVPKKRPRYAPVPRFAYLGAGAKVQSLKTWIRFIRDHTQGRYIDLTAGSNNQPFAVAQQLSRPIAVNDICYYSHLIARGIFLRSGPSNERAIRDALETASQNKKPGRFMADKEWILDPSIKLFVDGLVEICSIPGSAHNQYLLACLGSVMLAKLTMRASGYIIKNGKQAGGEPISRNEFAQAVFNKAVACNRFHSRPGAGEGRPYFGTLIQSVEKMKLDRVLKGATINIDYAWPFEEKENPYKNPYYGYLRVSWILGSPVDPKKFLYWKNEGTDNVLEECASMMALILRAGAARIFLWNQSTNRPAPELVQKDLKARGFSASEVLRIQRKSIRGTKVFDDVVLEVR